MKINQTIKCNTQTLLRIDPVPMCGPHSLTHSHVDRTKKEGKKLLILKGDGDGRRTGEKKFHTRKKCICAKRSRGETVWGEGEGEDVQFFLSFHEASSFQDFLKCKLSIFLLLFLPSLDLGCCSGIISLPSHLVCCVRPFLLLLLPLVLLLLLPCSGSGHLNGGWMLFRRISTLEKSQNWRGRGGGRGGGGGEDDDDDDDVNG